MLSIFYTAAQAVAGENALGRNVSIIKQNQVRRA